MTPYSKNIERIFQLGPGWMTEEEFYSLFTYIRSLEKRCVEQEANIATLLKACNSWYPGVDEIQAKHAEIEKR